MLSIVKLLLSGVIVLAAVVLQANNCQDAKNMFSTEETMAKVNTALEAYGIDENQNTALVLSKKVLKEKLKNFKVTGVSFCADPNFGFIYDNQNPIFDVCYKNSKGQEIFRKYLASINSIGFKFQFSINILCVFIVNTPFNFYDSNNTIDLGMGIDVVFSTGVGSGILLMYAPFKNMIGGLFIVGLPIGCPGESLSLVTDGFLTPCDSNGFPFDVKSEDLLTNQDIISELAFDEND